MRLVKIETGYDTVKYPVTATFLTIETVSSVILKYLIGVIKELECIDIYFIIKI
ncbi:MAG: hypothetical protein LBB45_07500 [Methanobrevibacter sp.]|jgi:hypothetical protein|nr:hypothetical protein [Candidatus Methanovirga basalitermitum]